MSSSSINSSSKAASNSAGVSGSVKARSVALSAGAISFLSYGKLRFIICDCPSNSNIDEYIKQFKKHKVSDVVRLCEASYSSEPIKNAGMIMHEMAFEDGGVPPEGVVKRWLDICQSRFGSFKSVEKTSSDAEEEDDPSCIAVHCVAGLGRAPVLVAIALIEYGVDKLDAIEFVRRKRRGAFNSRQIQYVDMYKRQNAPSKLLKNKLLRMFRIKNGG